MNTNTPTPGEPGDTHQANELPNELPPAEWLSAYLDGELTPDETEILEAHLVESPASRRALDDLRAVSNILAELPRQSAPAVLQHRITASIAAETPTTRPADATSDSRSRWPMATAIVAVVALVLVAIVPDSLLRSPSSDDLGLDGQQLASGDLVAKSDMTSGGIPAAAAESIGAGAPGPSTSLDVAVGDAAEDVGFGGAGPEGGSKLVFPRSPGQAEVGQVLSAIDTTGGQAVVVQLTVVDVQQGFDSLRLLLQEHQIASADLPTSPRTPATADAPHRDAKRTASKQAAAGHLVSIVVQASPRQVSTAMASFRSRLRAEMELTGVLEVAAIQKTPAGRQALDRLQSYGNRLPASQTVSQAQSKGGKKPRSTASVARNAAAGDRPGTNSDARLVSAQIRLDLPARLLKQVAAAQSPGNRSRRLVKRKGRQSPATSPVDPAAAGGDADRQSGRQLQVVFVLVGAPEKSDTSPDPDGAA